jgi:hypothetical protein
MKSAFLGLSVALLLLASAGAHAFLGWPPFRQLLDVGNIDSKVIAGLAVGWYFGSASMLGFAGVVFHQALRRLKGVPVQPGALWVISLMYIVFGTSAYLLRDFNSHFLLFILTGVLVGLFNFLCVTHVYSA